MVTTKGTGHPGDREDAEIAASADASRHQPIEGYGRHRAVAVIRKTLDSKNPRAKFCRELENRMKFCEQHRQTHLEAQS